MHVKLAKQFFEIDTIAVMLTHLEHKLNLSKEFFETATVFNKNLQQM
jgi:hypothetical protein